MSPTVALGWRQRWQRDEHKVRPGSRFLMCSFSQHLWHLLKSAKSELPCASVKHRTWDQHLLHCFC
jgi:hypothetical protein